MANMQNQHLLVSIVIPTYNRRDKLVRLVRSIYDSDYPAKFLEIIVIDDGSSDNTVTSIRTLFPNVKICSSENKLFCGGSRNLGMELSKGDYIVFIDDDNILDKSCITKLIRCFESNPQIGMCAPLMLDFGGDKNTIWCVGSVMSRFGRIISPLSGLNINSVKLKPLIYDIEYFPNFYAIRRQIKELGIKHDSYLFPHNWSEFDFALRVKRAGFIIADCTSAITWHDIGYHSLTTRISETNAYDQSRSRILFARKYGSSLFKIYFFCLLLPATLIYYMYLFLKQPIANRNPLIWNYLKGIWFGTITRISD